MIIRVFRGSAQPGMEEDLRSYMRDKAMPEFRGAPGLLAAHMGSSPDDDSAAIFVTMWQDLDSLIAFAGPDWQRVMTSPDERQLLGAASVSHFILEDDGSQTPLTSDPPRTARTLRARHQGGDARALVYMGSTMDVSGIVSALGRRGFPALIAPAAPSAASLLTRWRPDVAIVGADADGAGGLLKQLERIEVPVLLVGDGRLIGSPARRNIRAAVLALAEPEEIAAAVEIVIGRPPLHGMPELLDAGEVRVDVTERLAYVNDQQVELPPKEFALLAELALHPGQPITSSEIAARVWPESAWITGDDVRRTVYRLRKLIGDDERDKPLIRNRRGHGYVLEPH